MNTHDQALSNQATIKRLKLSKINAFDNNMYDFNKETFEENVSLTSSLILKKFYNPIPDKYSNNAYYNFMSKQSRDFINSSIFAEYIKVFNKKFICFNSKDLQNNKLLDNNLILTNNTIEAVSCFIKKIENSNIIVDFNKINFIILDNKVDFLLVSIESGIDKWFLFNQIFDENWKIEIDNRQGHIYKSNIYFQSFFVPAGKHTVKIYYQNNYLKYSIIFNYFFTIILLLFIYYFYFLKNNHFQNSNKLHE